MNAPAQISPSSLGTTATQGTSVSGGGGAGVYTSTKVQLVASSAEDWCGIWAMTTQGTSAGSLWKLYVGGSGSESEFVEFVGSNAETEPLNLYLPLRVPAGSRVSVAKADPDGFGSAARIHIVPVRGASYDRLASRGTLIGGNNGSLTDVDAGATVNTKGAWVQLIASTVRDAKGFTLVGYGDASLDANQRFHVDVGVGGAGSEQVIFADAAFAQESYRIALKGSPIGPVWTPIPAGSRVAVRAQCSSATATLRVPRLAIILWE